MCFNNNPTFLKKLKVTTIKNYKIFAESSKFSEAELKILIFLMV